MTYTTYQVDYTKKWYVMAAVGMGIFLATIDSSIVNVALPTLVEDFGAVFATVQWVVLAYLLTVTTLMLSVGRLADMIGKKPPYTWGFIIFTIGSVLCGLSWSIQALILFRVLQALGAALVMALGMAIVIEAFPPSQRGKALGISGSILSVGIVLGPTLGGILIQSLSWHWIFFVNLPIGIIGTWMSIRFVPSLRPPGGQMFDIWGGLAFFATLLVFLLALTLGQQVGFTAIPVLALFLGSLLLLLLFVYIEGKTSDPMLDLRIFRDRHFSVSMITAVITFISIAGATFLMPFYLQDVLGYNPQQVGFLLAVVPVVLAVVSPISGEFSDRFGTRLISVLGLVLLTIGYAAMRTLTTQTTAVGFILRFLAVGVGMGVFQSPNNSAIMGSAPREKLGVVSGTLAIARTMGQTVGIATLGSVWANSIIAMSPGVSQDSITNAPASIQVIALQQTFTVVTVLILFALGLGIWVWSSERRIKANSPEFSSE
jgi:EmrB/QacA subfamily drug resistance transporter